MTKKACHARDRETAAGGQCVSAVASLACRSPALVRYLFRTHNRDKNAAPSPRIAEFPSRLVFASSRRRSGSSHPIAVAGCGSPPKSSKNVPYLAERDIGVLSDIVHPRHPCLLRTPDRHLPIKCRVDIENARAWPATSISPVKSSNTSGLLRELCTKDRRVVSRGGQQRGLSRNLGGRPRRP